MAEYNFLDDSVYEMPATRAVVPSLRYNLHKFYADYGPMVEQVTVQSNMVCGTYQNEQEVAESARKSMLVAFKLASDLVSKDRLRTAGMFAVYSAVWLVGAAALYTAKIMGVDVCDALTSGPCVDARLTYTPIATGGLFAALSAGMFLSAESAKEIIYEQRTCSGSVDPNAPGIKSVFEMAATILKKELSRVGIDGLKKVWDRPKDISSPHP